jgi:hypothetical protein
MNCKGQFSIIAALLVAVILIATVIITYSTIRSSPIQVQSQILSTIDETNLALKEILGFTVGYYGSVLQVTGNSSYARDLATNYARSGLENIARMRPELGASFNLSVVELSAYWYTNYSWSRGKLAVDYNLTGLGLYGMNYNISCALTVQVKGTTSDNKTILVVTKDEGEPVINLGSQNFKFYQYIYLNSTWTPIYSSAVAYANGTYLVNIPSKIDPSSYVIQVEDQRGVIVMASSFSRYTCTLEWNSTLYQTLKNATDATIVVEFLQNGTMRWLGQNLLNLTTQAKPIPPIPVKAIHVNQTINGIDREVPFQIEEWASDYRVPLSLASNVSIFSNRNMLVFLVNPNVSKVTIWWNGSDTAIQTPLAYTNKYFTVDTSQRTLSNGILGLKIDFSSQGGITSFKVKSTMNALTATAEFMRINSKVADYGDSEPNYAITNGPVRAVINHEVEWGPETSQQISDCRNFYAHIVLTLPANATCYTYQLRLIFLNSTDRPRTITDLCPIQINALETGVFGSTATSSSWTSVSADDMYGSVFTSPSVAVIANSISFYGRRSSYGTSNVKCLIVRHSDMQIIAVTNPVSVGSTLQWWTATFSSPPVLSPNTNYVLMIIPDGTVRFYYTTGSADQGHYDTTNSYISPTNPTDIVHNNYQYSIYCNYTILQTENGTSSGYPIVSNESGLFYNSSTTCWQHHWSQLSSTLSRGFGIMFTDDANKMLYFFDKMVGSTTGAISVSSTAIELLPVSSRAQVSSFTSPLDICWYGAAVTFDGTTPIYRSSDKNGLWVLVEYPPIITVTTEN